MVNVNINGVSYQIPNTGEEGWGDNVTNWIVAASSFLLQRSGGSFPLSAEVDLGAVAGLRALIYRSQASDVAASGVLRLGNADKISFRNAANSADLQLGLSTDILQFNGISLIQAGLGSIVNADVNAAAAIALSKLATLTASRALVSDSSGVIVPSSVTSTELGYVSGVTSSIQSQINALVVGAGIDQLTGDVTAGPGFGSQVATIANQAITNAKVSNSAAIAYSKLNLTTSVKASDQDSQASLSGAVLTANGSGGSSYVAPIIAAYSSSLNQSLLTGTLTTINFNVQQIDTNSAVSGGVFTAPAAGIYEVTANVTADTAATLPQLRLLKNTVAIQNIKGTSGSFTPGTLSHVVSLAASDTIAFGYIHSTGLTIAVDSSPLFTFMSIRRIAL